jgi:hypothetical protein
LQGVGRCGTSLLENLVYLILGGPPRPARFSFSDPE